MKLYGRELKLYSPELEHLKIPLEEIKSATNNFDETYLIEHGGSGRVYKGELSHFKRRRMVAIWRLDHIFGQGPDIFGQGSTEFKNKVKMLSLYKHENLISLVGFCSKGGENILVYEHASNGSLDRHLSSTTLTWMHRIKICLGAARGLSYLHFGNVTSPRIIHGDIKSSNILLDENWNAKVSLEFSKFLSLQSHQFVLRRAGISGYCDPVYVENGILTKESDVYSFGVVLIEVLCGRLCFDICYGQAKFLVPMWIETYKQNKLQEIIFDGLKQQIDQKSLETYADIAFKCMHKSCEQRPTMPYVVEKLETTLKYQELYEGVKLTNGYKQMLMITVEDPLNNIPENELKMLLFKGTLLNSGKTWFSLNAEGDHCEMISIAECLTSTASESPHYIHSSEYISRFAVGCYEPFGANFKTHVRTQFLSPGITYIVNLVLKNKSKSRYIGLKYKLKGELSNSYSFLSDEREDGWLTAELYQFTSDKRTVDLEIWFYTECCPTLLVESIEFLPLKKGEHAVLTDDKVDTQPILDNDTYWEQKLPIDYKDIIRRSKDPVQWKTKKDLYSIFCKGFVISYGDEWFYLAKDGKKCLMLPARAALEEDRWEWKPEPETRFEEVADCIFDTFGIFCKFYSKMLSPQTTYAAFLIYKLPDDYESVDQPPPVQVVDDDFESDSDSDSDSKEVYYIFLRTPQTPVISWNEKEEKTFKPSSRPKIKGLPKQRSDGWMEVQVHEFQTRATIKMICMCLKLSSNDMSLKGVIVLGLECRPV